MVGGQADDLAAEFRQIGLHRLQSIHRRKTGALFGASLQLGAIVAVADADQRQRLAVFGDNLGHAFQIVDDLLDVAGEENRVGKRVGKDEQHGKVTYPALLGVEESRRRVGQLIEQATTALEPFGHQAKPLRNLAQFVARRSQ
jgi:geranylgeranyl diphosphate synthase type II